MESVSRRCGGTKPAKVTVKSEQVISRLFLCRRDRGPERVIRNMLARERALGKAYKHRRGGEGRGKHKECQSLWPQSYELDHRNRKLRGHPEDQHPEPIYRVACVRQ